MIAPAYVRTMAAYNAEMNRRTYAAADTLTEAQRQEDAGAFFKSLHGTLCHLLWADHGWMSRFAGWELPPVGIAVSAGWVPTGRSCASDGAPPMPAWKAGQPP
jgi:uncharacterized damage-inducible protein DinB